MNTDRPQGKGTITPATLRLVRWFLVAGWVLSGVGAWYALQQGSGVAPVSASIRETLQTALWIAVAVIVGALLLVRWITAKQASFDRRAALSIVGWVIGETLALLAVVFFVITEDFLYLLVGGAAMGIAFLILPVPRRTE